MVYYLWRPWALSSQRHRVIMMWKWCDMRMCAKKTVDINSCKIIFVEAEIILNPIVQQIRALWRSDPIWSWYIKRNGQQTRSNCEIYRRSWSVQIFRPERRLALGELQSRWDWRPFSIRHRRGRCSETWTACGNWSQSVEIISGIAVFLVSCCTKTQK